MRTLRCTVCGHVWDCNIARPACPYCVAKQWALAPEMVTPKHDPRKLPSASTQFRSTVSYDMLDQPDAYFQYIAESGTAFYSHTPRHRDFSYACGVPPHLQGGSAIPVGQSMPTHSMDSYTVVQAFGPSAHIFAQDEAKIRADLEAGELVFLPNCSVDGCELRSVPGSGFCVLHHDPPLAVEVIDEGSDGTATNS